MASPLPGEVADIFGVFSCAESAAEEAVDQILSEGGRLLYETYISKKSFTFASEASCDYLLAELQMCFVRNDRGEPVGPPPGELGPGERREGWELEAEPRRARIDTWARACVPIRRKLVQPRTALTEDPRRKNFAKSSARSGSQRSPSRNTANPPTVMDTEASKASSGRSQMIPLVEETEEDEEEAIMRDMKDREARRKRDEEAKVQRKVQEEAEESAKLAQMKDQMKNKPFTYDSQGNVIWIQPVRTDKLPPSNPVPAYSFKKEIMADMGTGTFFNPVQAPARKSGEAPKKQRSREFTDGFKKFGTQQPAMAEVMDIAPGVMLMERGSTKKGAERMREPGQAMSRKDYEAMVSKGVAGLTIASDLAPLVISAPVEAAQSIPRDASFYSAANNEASTQGGAAPRTGRTTDTGLRVVQGADLGASLLPQPPATPRPVQPQPPSSVRRLQMKRDALGFNQSVRDRPPRAGTLSARDHFMRCGAQPPVGATMGHGLLPAGERNEEYYFPLASDAAPSFAEELPSEDRARAGQLVAENPELLRKLFAGRS